MFSKHLSWFVTRFIQIGLVSIDIHRYVVDFESVVTAGVCEVWQKHLSWFVTRFNQIGLVSIDINRYVVDFESVITAGVCESVAKTSVIAWDMIYLS